MSNGLIKYSGSVSTDMQVLHSFLSGIHIVLAFNSYLGSAHNMARTVMLIAMLEKVAQSWSGVKRIANCNFSLSGTVLKVCTEACHAQANTLIGKFGMGYVQVKATLLWRRCRRSSLQKVAVAYTDGTRLLHKVPRWSSASQQFVSVGVPVCLLTLVPVCDGPLCP